MEEPDSRAEKKLKRWEGMKAARQPRQSMWDELSDYVMPEESYSSSVSSGGSRREAYDRMFDGTAARANWILANGQFSHVTPPQSSWFAFEPSRVWRGDEQVVRWYRERTEIAQEIVQNSRFYSQMYRVYLQRGGFGQGCLFVKEGESNPLHFRSFAVGSYCIDDNHEGVIDTVYRTFELSAHTAVEFFGTDSVGDDVSRAAGSENPKDGDKKFEFLHCVEPRKKRDASKIDAKNKPISSIYIDVKAKKVVREGGFDSMPYMVSRYHESSSSIYGWGPGFLALPESRQLNYLEANLDVLAEKKAFPPMLIPADMEGELDISAGGITTYNPFLPQHAQPREWNLAGDYQHGEIRAEHKRRAINQAFHVDLFQMFNEMDVKNMTAREVAERSNEKLTQFYPTHALMTTELLTPLLRRVFELTLSIEGVGDIPPQLIVDTGNGNFIAPPEVSYSSSLALAIKRVHNASFLSTQGILGPMVEANPGILNHFDWDTITRDVARNEGMPEKWLLDLEKVQEIKAQQQAEAQRQQQILEQATVADAVSKTKGQPVDEIEEKLSLVG